MLGFEYRGGELFCEDVAVAGLAEDYGTPLYVYSKQVLETRYKAITDAFSSIDTTVCFSVKSCSNLGVLKVLAAAGSGFDVVSGGEIYRVVKAGGDPTRIVYAGVGKTDKEIQYALEQDIMLFNVESEAELQNINDIAALCGKVAPVALRLNPDVDPVTHKKTTTGLKENKFGVDFEIAAAIIRKLDTMPNVCLKGLDVHLGSPINTIGPYAESLDKVVGFVESNPAVKDHLEFINCGGGYGLLYQDETVPSFSEYAEAILERVNKLGCRLILEPGRSIAGNAGILLGSVQYIKSNGEKTFAILDAGMHNLIRPAMYESYHGIWPVRGSEPELPRGVAREAGELIPTDVVGPICESSDVFCKDRPLPPLQRGDCVSIFSAGAYGFVMSSQYNSHPRPAEILVDGNSWQVIRERESWDDLVAKELL